MNDTPPQDPAHIGKSVRFAGTPLWTWKITGINWLGEYDLERFEEREDGTYKIGTSCLLTLPEDHPHYAYLVAE